MKKPQLSLSMWIPTVVALVARLAFIGRKSLWIDEALASGVSGMGPGELAARIATGTPHPPLAFLLIRFSTLLFGTSEAGLRTLIAVAVASASIPVYRLVLRSVGRRPAFWSAMLWAVSPFTVSLGQEVWAYGVNAALSLWLLDLADQSWRGSRRALIGFTAVGIAGILTQHIFLISILIAFGYYFAIPSLKRVSWKVPVTFTGLLMLTYLPVGLFFLEQFRARSIRLASTGLGGGFRMSLLTRVPSEFLRLISGGLLPEITPGLLDRPGMLVAHSLNALLVMYMLVRTFFTRETAWRLRIWILASLALPLALFWKDDPTVRQLAAVWMPFVLACGLVFRRDRWSGPVVVSLCVLALIPYYSLESFPYHRSNWREGVRAVESLAEASDVVLVVGGKSTALAWDYYATRGLARVTPGGSEPFLSEEERTRADVPAVLDSLMRRHERIWFIIDDWGGVSSRSLSEGYLLMESIRISPAMEVGLIGSRR